MLDKLIQLRAENPDTEVIFMTHYEVVEADYGYWKGMIEKVEKEFVMQIDERLKLSKDDIKDAIAVNNDIEDEFVIQDIFEQKIISGEIQEKIIVYINL